MKLVLKVVLSLLLTSCAILRAQGFTKIFESQQGRFSVMIDSKPSESVDLIKSELGEVTSTVYFWDVDTMSFYIATLDYAENALANRDSKPILENYIKGSIKNFTNVECTRKEEVAITGQPAVLYEYTAKDQQESGRMIAVVFLVKDRLYAIVAMGSLKVFKENLVHSFIDSFTLSTKN